MKKEGSKSSPFIFFPTFAQEYSEMVGTLVNTGAIIGASAIGLLLHRRLPQKLTGIVFQAIGLVTVAIGISMSMATGNILFAVVSLVLGAVIGQWIGIDEWLRRFSALLQGRGRKSGEEPQAAGIPVRQSRTAGSPARFTEGFITATMIFCLGSMSILGALEDGMGERPTLLFTKSIMDAVTAMILTSSFGVGVMFAAIPVLVYQGGLTWLAAFLTSHMTEAMIADMTGVGGILLIGLGISLLKINEINVVNMLPALVVVLIVSYFFG